jgi:hypothetical protein
MRYRNNSNYKNDTEIRKKAYVSQAVLDELKRIIADTEVRRWSRAGGGGHHSQQQQQQQQLFAPLCAAWGHAEAQRSQLCVQARADGARQGAAV